MLVWWKNFKPTYFFSGFAITALILFSDIIFCSPVEAQRFIQPRRPRRRPIVPVPTQPVPEPLTILGSSAAIAYGMFFKRELLQKNKQK